MSDLAGGGTGGVPGDVRIGTVIGGDVDVSCGDVIWFDARDLGSTKGGLLYYSVLSQRAIKDSMVR